MTSSSSIAAREVLYEGPQRREEPECPGVGWRGVARVYSGIRFVRQRADGAAQVQRRAEARRVPRVRPSQGVRTTLVAALLPVARPEARNQRRQLLRVRRLGQMHVVPF